MAIVRAYFWFIASCLLVGSAMLHAEPKGEADKEAPPTADFMIKKVYGQKNMVLINAGKDQGIKSDTKVCFFDEAGKKITCGKVKKATKDKTLILVKKSILPKLTEGTKAKFDSPMKPKAGKGGEGEDGKGGDKATAETASNRPSIIIRPYMSPSLMSTTVYNDISYSAPASATTTKVASLWKTSATVSSSTYVFGAEVELTKFNLAVGFRMKTFQPSDETDKYDASAPQLYLSTAETGSATGVYADYYWYSMFDDIKIGTGLDIENSNVTYLATRKDISKASKDADLYSLVSSVNVISIRIPVKYDLFFGNFGLTAALIPYLPIMATAPSVTATVSDPNNGKKVADPKADVTTALGHTKGTIGMDILIGAFYGF